MATTSQALSATHFWRVRWRRGSCSRSSAAFASSMASPRSAPLPRSYPAARTRWKMERGDGAFDRESGASGNPSSRRMSATRSKKCASKSAAARSGSAHAEGSERNYPRSAIVWRLFSANCRATYDLFLFGEEPGGEALILAYSLDPIAVDSTICSTRVSRAVSSGFLSRGIASRCPGSCRRSRRRRRHRRECQRPRVRP
jgi:hypothetical protein